LQRSARTSLSPSPILINQCQGWLSNAPLVLFSLPKSSVSPSDTVAVPWQGYIRAPTPHRQDIITQVTVKRQNVEFTTATTGSKYELGSVQCFSSTPNARDITARMIHQISLIFLLTHPLLRFGAVPARRLPEESTGQRDKQ
jgi:hypothetical protein